MRVLIVLLGLCLVLESAAAAATIDGRIKEQGVVWLSGAPAAAAVQLEMRNKDRSFVPPLLVVSTGSTVRFPNDDYFYHSIYASDGPDDFDVGYYLEGPGKVFTFSKPGVVNIRCHIHPSMHGTIIVVDGPAQQTSGAFHFANIAPGKYTLHTWNAGTNDERKEALVIKDANEKVTLPQR